MFSSEAAIPVVVEVVEARPLERACLGSDPTGSQLCGLGPTALPLRALASSSGNWGSQENSLGCHGARGVDPHRICTEKGSVQS